MWLLVEVTRAGPVVRTVGPAARDELQVPAGAEGELLALLPSPSPTLLRVVDAVTACLADTAPRTVDTAAGPVVVEHVQGATSTWVVVHAQTAQPSIERFFHRASVGAFVTTVSGVIRFCNATYAGYLGRKPSELPGRHNRELFGATLAERFEARNREVFSSGQAAEMIETFDTAQGTRTFFVSLFPVPHTSPIAEAEVAGVLMDVTERLTVQAQQERTLRTVLETLNDGVWLVDSNWRTTYANPALGRMLGLEVAQLVGRAATDFIKQEDAPRYAAAIAEREQLRSSHPAETRLLRADGTVLTAMGSSARMTDEQGRFAGAVAVLMDLSEQKRREQEELRAAERLREAQKLESLGVLAGGIAHDFNNLLSVILGTTSGLRDELDRSLQGAESVTLIEKAATRAAELCRQMLAFSGRGHFVVKPVDLSAHIGASIELARASVDKRHALRLGFAPALPMVNADTSQLSQVLLSLIVNASEAIGPRPGEIGLTTSVIDADPAYLQSTYLAPDLPAGRYVCLDVSDDGEGMTDEVQARLFEPYFSTRATGRGLGLPATLGVLRGHRGAIKVTSAPGKGACVRVLFPAIESAPIASATPSPVVQTKGAGRVVLVVDDEPLVRSTLKRMLARDGYVVIEAFDGLDALEHLSRLDRPDVVLLDLSMPRLDGADTFRQLQRLYPTLPVVLMSGYSEQDAVQRFLREDLAGFVQKPFSNAEVLRCLSRALSKHA